MKTKSEKFSVNRANGEKINKIVNKLKTLDNNWYLFEARYPSGKLYFEFMKNNAEEPSFIINVDNCNLIILDIDSITQDIFHEMAFLVHTVKE